VSEVIAVDHSLVWASKMSASLPSNASCIFRPKNEESYAKEIHEHSGLFDLVVIDGANRVQCALSCVEKMTPSGVIVWDNSDRVDQYSDGYAMLASRGFRRIDFEGLAAFISKIQMTTVFYRNENCFGI
jgi:hypothetical protein